MAKFEAATKLPARIVREPRPVWRDMFHDPTELLVFCDPDIESGRMQLHDWQVREHQRFMREFEAEEPDPTGALNIIQNDLCLKAANDSGKSKMVLAPCAFFTLMWEWSRSIITSSSGVQLDGQSGKYVRMLANHFNSRFGADLIKVNERKLIFHENNSDILLFATDESGRAEGWHKLKADSPLTIFFDEAKTIDSGIYVAAARCHDAQRFYKLSSPGHTAGGFYESCNSGFSEVVTVSAYDCPHITKYQIDKVVNQFGINSPFTKSIIFGEFADYEGLIFITSEQWDAATKSPAKLFDDGVWRLGLDVAAGGDENVLSVWRGNEEKLLLAFREPNTRQTVYKIHDTLEELGVPQKGRNLQFSMDDNGVGKGIYDGIVEKGWSIHRCTTHMKPRNPKIYANRGAEIYDKFASLVKMHMLRPKSDAMARSQLVSRSYEAKTGKMRLEDKRKLKDKNANYKSPDRADARTLAWAQTNPVLFKLEFTKHNRVFRLLKTEPKQKEERGKKAYERFKYKQMDRLMENSNVYRTNFQRQITTDEAMREILQTGGRRRRTFRNPHHCIKAQK